MRRQLNNLELIKLLKLLKNQQITLIDGVTLRRVQAACDLPMHGVAAGTLGGWAQSLNNVGADCWIANNAMLWGDAKLIEGSLLTQHAQVWGSACIRGRSTVAGHARVFGAAVVDGGSTVRGAAMVHGLAQIRRGALIQQDADIGDHAQVGKRARVGGNVVLRGTVEVYANISDSENLTFGIVI